jgi:hypothetical protein
MRRGPTSAHYNPFEKQPFLETLERIEQLLETKCIGQKDFLRIRVP